MLLVIVLLSSLHQLSLIVLYIIYVVLHMCVRVCLCAYTYTFYIFYRANIIKFNMQIAFKPSIFHNFNSVTPYDELLGENEFTSERIGRLSTSFSPHARIYFSKQRRRRDAFLRGDLWRKERQFRGVHWIFVTTTRPPRFARIA